MTLRKNMAAIILSCIFALSFPSPAGCTPPNVPCDEKVDNPKTYENMVLRNPVIQRLNSRLDLREVRVSPCFVRKRLMVAVDYDLPEAFSEYGLAYLDWVLINCSKDGRITSAPEQYLVFDADSILAFFRGKIRKIEQDPRVREFMARTMPNPENPIISLREAGVVIRRPENFIEYNQYSGLVSGYFLSNKIDWQNFPEIKQAQRAIEEHFLIGALSDCRIGYASGRSHTSASFHFSPRDPWYMTLHVTCPDGEKDVVIHINSDGSHDTPTVKLEY